MNLNPSMPQRIAIVSRRFWPISGPTEHFVADVGDHFSAAGHRVRLFTAAWQKGWPSECSFREFDVRRLNRPSSGPWGTYRYQRALVRELDHFQPEAVLMLATAKTFRLSESSSAIRYLASFASTIEPFRRRVDRRRRVSVSIWPMRCYAIRFARAMNWYSAKRSCRGRWNWFPMAPVIKANIDVHFCNKPIQERRSATPTRSSASIRLNRWSSPEHR